jgi:hypothetical protein
VQVTKETCIPWRVACYESMNGLVFENLKSHLTFECLKYVLLSELCVQRTCKVSGIKVVAASRYLVSMLLSHTNLIL